MTLDPWRSLANADEIAARTPWYLTLEEQSALAAHPASASAGEPVAWVRQTTLQYLSSMSPGATSLQISNVSFDEWSVPLYTAPPATPAASASAGEPMIRALEWRDAPKGKYLSRTIAADTILGPYTVTISNQAAYFDNLLIKGHGSGIEAAQAHFDAAIRSALTAPPAPTAGQHTGEEA